MQMILSAIANLQVKRVQIRGQVQHHFGSAAAFAIA
jgi:hypothetical protein